MFHHYKMVLVSAMMTQLFLAQPYANEVIPLVAYPEARARHRALGRRLLRYIRQLIPCLGVPVFSS